MAFDHAGGARAWPAVLGTISVPQACNRIMTTVRGHHHCTKLQSYIYACESGVRLEHGLESCPQTRCGAILSKTKTFCRDRRKRTAPIG